MKSDIIAEERIYVVALGGTSNAALVAWQLGVANVKGYSKQRSEPISWRRAARQQNDGSSKAVALCNGSLDTKVALLYP